MIISWRLRAASSWPADRLSMPCFKMATRFAWDTVSALTLAGECLEEASEIDPGSTPQDPSNVLPRQRVSNGASLVIAELEVCLGLRDNVESGTIHFEIWSDQVGGCTNGEATCPGTKLGGDSDPFAVDGLADFNTVNGACGTAGMGAGARRRQCTATGNPAVVSATRHRGSAARPTVGSPRDDPRAAERAGRWSGSRRARGRLRAIGVARDAHRGGSPRPQDR